MRYLIITLSILGILIGGATYAARYDWSLGQPEITADFGDNDRFDWTLGQPDVVDDFTTAEAPAAAGGESVITFIVEEL